LESEGYNYRNITPLPPPASYPGGLYSVELFFYIDDDLGQPTSDFRNINFNDPDDLASKLAIAFAEMIGGVWTITHDGGNPVQITSITGENVSWRLDGSQAPVVNLAAAHFPGPYSGSNFDNITDAPEEYLDPYIAIAGPILKNTTLHTNSITQDCVWSGSDDLVTAEGTGQLNYDFTINPSSITLAVEIRDFDDVVIASNEYEFTDPPINPTLGYQCDKLFLLQQVPGAQFSTTGPTMEVGGPTPGLIMKWGVTGVATMNPGADVPQPPPPESVFAWNTASVSKATYDAWLATMPTDPGSGRPKPNTNNFKQVLSNGDFLGAPINYEMPTMDGDGTLRMLLDSTYHNEHTMLSCESPHADLDWRYLKPNIDYRINFGLTLDTTTYSESQWQALPWLVLWQLHPGTWGPSWPPAVGKEPPIALYVYEGNFRLWVRGSTAVTPAGWTTNQSYPWPLVTGYHDFEVDVTIDHTGVNSYVQIKMDDVIKATVTHENGINAGGNTIVGSEWIAFGGYSFHRGPEVTFSNFAISKI
jgi:hypothetical protein